ncbi:MAG: hypothetical protein NUV53_02295 [Patescibacteria group bacterium]|nr:hypothetical protein [Patescibacteria group bacterium]
MQRRAVVIAGIFSVFMVGAALVYAQDTNTAVEPANTQVGEAGIVFPVPELGNCGSKGECKTYCNDPAHADACIAFAQAHGLMNKDEAQRAKTFTQAVAKGGPGGCTTPQECEHFCSDISNLEVCVKFTKDHGIKSDHTDDGAKILKHLQSGGKMPGGCTSKESCESYCSDFSHAEECFNFAKKAGITQGKGPQRGDSGNRGREPSLEQIKTIASLMQEGKTPGGCTSKESCESYCGNADHGEECTAFGEKVGFISHDEATRIRETGGKGPGGCDSPQACEQYCNDSTHQQECFDFGVAHGFISKEEAQRVKDGVVNMRAGIEHAPPEVVACLKSTLGQELLDNIQSGKLTPGRDIGERMRNCFEKFGQKGNPQEIFKKAPPEVIACLKDKLGDTFERVLNGKESPTPEVADTFRVCSQSIQFERQFEHQEGGLQEGGFFGDNNQNRQGGSPQFGPPPQMLQDFIRTAPPGIVACLKEKMGGNLQNIQEGKQVEGFDPSVMKSCFEQFSPSDDHFRPDVQGRPQSGNHDVFSPNEGREQGFGPGGIPREIISCVKERVGGEVNEEKIRAGMGDQGNLGQAIRECFGKISQGGGNNNMPGLQTGQPGAQMSPQRDPSLRQGNAIPEVVLICVKEKLGGAVDIEKIRHGDRSGSEVEKAIADCFSKTNFQPQNDKPGIINRQPLRPQDNFASGTIPFSGQNTVFPRPEDNKQPNHFEDDRREPPQFDSRTQEWPNGEIHRQDSTGFFPETRSGEQFPQNQPGQFPPSQQGESFISNQQFQSQQLQNNTFIQPSGPQPPPVMPIPSGEILPPPPIQSVPPLEESSPSSAIPQQSLLGAILAPFLNVIGIGR